MNRSPHLLLVFLVALPLAFGWVLGAEPWLSSAIGDGDEPETEVEGSKEAVSDSRHRTSPVRAVKAARPRARPPRRIPLPARAPAPASCRTAAPLRC